MSAETDVEYSPYCMRCTTARRMLLIRPFYWRCGRCGAEHDERTPTHLLLPSEAP